MTVMAGRAADLAEVGFVGIDGRRTFGGDLVECSVTGDAAGVYIGFRVSGDQGLAVAGVAV